MQNWCDTAHMKITDGVLGIASTVQQRLCNVHTTLSRIDAQYLWYVMRLPN